MCTCARVDGAIGAPTKRSAALGRHDDSLAARRSLGGLCRCRLRQSRAGDATQRRGDVTRHTAHTTRRVRVRVSTARSARRQRGRRRSVGTTTRSRLGARSAGFAGVGSDRAEPAMQRKGAVMSLDTRRTRHGVYVCACRRRDRRADKEVGGARSARRLARGSALARRALPVSAQTEPSRRCNAKAR